MYYSSKRLSRSAHLDPNASLARHSLYTLANPTYEKLSCIKAARAAEARAAKFGLEVLAEDDDRNSEGRERNWIIATDSEYVVRGMTEWLPTWKACTS